MRSHSIFTLGGWAYTSFLALQVPEKSMPKRRKVVLVGFAAGELEGAQAMLQAEEFVTLVGRDELGGVLRRAAAAHPRCLINLIVDGLYHYMEVRERREFRSDPCC
jgi:hypothetical protein